MRLTQPERIQVLRKRAGLNQGELGVRAFGLSRASGRTKIKNIELGKQLPSAQELEQIARAIDAPVSKLVPAAETPSNGSCRLSQQVLSLYPRLDVYVDMLNKAVRLDDRDLTNHITEKIAEILTREPELEVVGR